MEERLKLPDWLTEEAPEGLPPAGRTKESGFIRRNLRAVASLSRWLDESEKAAGARGLLQRLNPAARISGVLILLVAAGLSHTFLSLSAIAVVCLILTLASRVRTGVLAKRVFPVFLFTTVVAAPVIFDLFTPGRTLFILPLSGGIPVTVEGLAAGVFFVLRTTLMVSLAALLVLTTRHSEFFTGLRRLYVPALFTTVLYMTFRHIFILLKTVEESSLARRSRTVNPGLSRDSRRWFADRVAFLLRKAVRTAGEVSDAMAARGFDGLLKVAKGEGPALKDLIWPGFSLAVLFICLYL